MTMFASVGKPAHAESIKIGISKLIGYPGVPIAVERGYFKEQGIDAAPIRSRGINRKAS
jgi:ABC-type nitrate/sulfonate/bicarbonate transport system substrate-binding protein